MRVSWARTTRIGAAAMTAKFEVPKLFPSPLPEARYAQNDDHPGGVPLRRGAWALNYASRYQRKQLLSVANTALATPSPASSLERNIYFVFRTGENVESVSILLGMAPASATSGSNRAYCELSLYDGSTTVTSEAMYYPEVAAGNYQPSDISWGEAKLDVSPNTVYVGYITQRHYGRIHSVMVHENAPAVSQSSVVGVCNPLLWESLRPINDDGIQELCETATTLWRHNGRPLISWPRRSEATAPSISSTSYVNVLQTATTAWSASAPGVMLNTEFHNTLGDDVPVELAIYATRTAGSGTLSVRLVQDGSTVLTETGIDEPDSFSPCAVSAHTIAALAAAKTDIMASVSDGSTTWRIDAIGLWEYEA